MPAKSQPEAQATAITESFAKVQTNTLDAVSAFAEINQRVLGELIDLSSTAAKEGLRTYTELQSAAVEAVRTTPGPVDQSEMAAEFRQDPFAWYRKSLMNVVDGTQRIVKLFEDNSQIVSRSAERFQASAERTGKEIQNAVGSYVNRIKEIYARN
jgi:hypothetical protein